MAKIDDLLKIFAQASGQSEKTARQIAREESNFGKAKGYEGIGGTQGVFHITKDAAMDVADEEEKKILKGKSKKQFAKYMAENPELDAKLAGRHTKKLADNMQAKGVVLDNLTDEEKASVLSNLYNYGRQKNLINKTAELSQKRFVLSRDATQDLKKEVTDQMDIVKAGGKVMPGLVKRRNREKELFMKEVPMAKEKKKKGKGPIGGMSLMDPIQQMMIGSDKAGPNMSMEVQSMPRTEPEKPPVAPPPPPQAEREPASTKEEEAVKDTIVKATRPDPQDVGKQKGLTQFQKALSYFGPRLIAQLVGGNDALATTDAVMRGFESMQQQDADRQMRADAIQGRQDQQAEMQQARIDAAKSRADAKLAGETLKQQEALEQQLADSEASIREFQELDQALAQGGLTGPLDASLGRLERMFGTGGKKPSYRLRLEKLKVNEGLANIAKTKGAISDREMKLFLSPAPVLSDDESVWRDWIRTKMVMEQELQKRLRKRLNINSPEDQKQMVLFDDIEKNIAAQKIEAEERKDMEMLREKRRRMQAGPSANRRFK